MGTNTEKGWCPICRSYQPATEVTEPADVEVINEDAQDVADYFRLNEHNSPDGLSCKGSGRTPSYLEEDPDEGPDDMDPPAEDEIMERDDLWGEDEWEDNLDF